MTERGGPATVRRWRDHYNRTARSYDRKEWLWGVLLGYSDMQERRRLVHLLCLRPGDRLLEVSAGTGTNLALAARAVSSPVRMTAQDISVGALRICRDKLRRQGEAVDLAESDAAYLPFRSNAFNAVLSFGGISQFGDTKRAIDEMVRVTKPGGRVVIGDVGIRPERRGSLRSRLALWVNSRYTIEPPTDLLPPGTAELQVDWFRNDTCYLLHCVKAGAV